MMIVIDDTNWQQHVNPVVNGEVKVCGTLPRDYSTHPHGCFAFAPKWSFPTYPQSEWAARRQAQAQAKRRLSDIRNTGMYGARIPSRDQNGKGYCWAHSGVSAHLLARAKMGQPYVDLSAFSVACMVKNFQDQGGWGLEGIEFQAEKGCATAEVWPQQSMDRSLANKPEVWANAALHKAVQWVELDPDNMKAQVTTALLNGWPVVGDYPWWSHSVAVLDTVSDDENDIWNSWSDSWSDYGVGRLKGSKAWPGSAWALIIFTPSVA